MSKTKMKFMPLRKQAEDELLRMARRFARMKLFGSYIENNMFVTVASSDQADLLKHFQWRLEDSAIKLLRAMSMDEIDGQLEE